MSLAFNDTTNLKGLCQVYEREIGVERGFITGNNDRLKELTTDVNLALDEFLSLAFRADGTWQFDDSNHTDFPIITTNLVASQRDYTFTTDEQGNLVLEIDKVLVADSGGTFHEVKPVDTQTQSDTNGFWNGSNTTGSPTAYDKTANGIFLDPIPNYNYTNGLKVYINREASYFTYTDTTRKPGVPGHLHRYFAIRPAYDYARRKNLANVQNLANELMQLEMNIEEHFAHRNADVRKRLTVTGNNK